MAPRVLLGALPFPRVPGSARRTSKPVPMTRRITPASYLTDENDRRLADQIMERAGLDPNDVTEIRVDETGASADVYDRDDEGHVTAFRTVVL